MSNIRVMSVMLAVFAGVMLFPTRSHSQTTCAADSYNCDYAAYPWKVCGTSATFHYSGGYSTSFSHSLNEINDPAHFASRPWKITATSTTSSSAMGHISDTWASSGWGTAGDYVVSNGCITSATLTVNRQVLDGKSQSIRDYTMLHEMVHALGFQDLGAATCSYDTLMWHCGLPQNGARIWEGDSKGLVAKYGAATAPSNGTLTLPPPQRAEIADLFDYGSGDVRAHLFYSPGGNGLSLSHSTWTTHGGYWPTSHVGNRYVAGQFDGVGKMDIATLYDYYANGVGLARVHTWLSNGSSFVLSNGYDPGWAELPGYWPDSAGGRFVAGDFNRDGKDDLATFYNYSGSYDPPQGAAAIHVLLSTGSSFALSNGYDPGWWRVNSTYWLSFVQDRMVAGDFNGDDRDDIATLYDYTNGAARMHVWLSNGTSFGISNGYEGWWRMDTSFYTSSVDDRMVAGDFNGDGRDDIAVLYDRISYDNTSRFYVFLSTGTGFTMHTWWSGTGYNPAQVGGRLVAADFNYDGKADMAAFREISPGRAVMDVWTSTGTAFTYQGIEWDSGATTSWTVGSKVMSRLVAGDFR